MLSHDPLGVHPTIAAIRTDEIAANRKKNYFILGLQRRGGFRKGCRRNTCFCRNSSCNSLRDAIVRSSRETIELFLLFLRAMVHLQ